MRSTILAIACTVATLGLNVDSARADHVRHDIDELANSLEQQSAQFIRELRSSFRHDNHYRSLYRNAYEIYGLASDIHDQAHDGHGLLRLRRDVRLLDGLIHELEDETEDLRRHGNRSSRYRHFRNGYDVRIGSRRGDDCQTRQLEALAESMKRTVHDLDDALDDLARRIDRRHSHVVVPQRPVIVSPRRPVRNSGFSLYRGANGRIGFSLNIR